ncbi:hypothetical protein LJC16_02115 [Bacteroidales bacterium OttesenSCG-928-C19]|nr:hypothetical protein [Bacteroidales bacterium OttesenSCG-928-C19]
MKQEKIIGTEILKIKGATYTGEATQEQYSKLVAKYGKINVMVIPVDKDLTDFAVVYLKGIDRQLMSAYLSSNDPVQKKEMLLDAIMVAGDERVKDDDGVFFSAMLLMDEVITFPLGVFIKG